MTTPRLTIIGSYISPYVRKVLVCLDLKGLAYEIDPIVPFFGNEEFSRLSPVRRIPVLVDGPVTLADSSVICAYLDERYPGHPLLPRDPAERARARWLEEFADTRMGDVFIWGLFNQRVINPFVWGQATDEQILRKTLEEDIPHVLGYLEAEVPAEGYLFGEMGVADISLAVFFRNAAFADFTIDAGRWPATAAFVSRVLDHPSFARLRPFEDLMMRTPIARHRAALQDAGAPLTATTFALDTPRRGMFRT